MKRTHEFAVDGVSYATTHYTTTRGLKLLAKLTKIASGPIAALASAGANMDTTLDAAMFGSLMGSISENLSEDDFVQVVQQILETTVCENQPIVFDVHFAGKYSHLGKVLKEVLFFQFDFLGKSPTASSPAPAPLKRHRA